MENKTTLTIPHKRLMKMLDELEQSHREEEQFGPYFLDCYLPEYHIGIEADGPYHLQKRDSIRDTFIWDTYFVPILRIHHIQMLTVKKRDKCKDKIVEFISTWQPTAHERRQRYKAVVSNGFST